jgi:hypothetical protein
LGFLARFHESAIDKQTVEAGFHGECFTAETQRRGEKQEKSKPENAEEAEAAEGQASQGISEGAVLAWENVAAQRKTKTELAADEHR